jgi:hypothetical protein
MIQERKGYLPTTSYISIAGALVEMQEHAPQRHLVRWSDTVDALRCFM